MKNKGFTLVELLAVIVILAIIMVIAIPSVLDTLTTAEKKTFEEYIDKVQQATQTKVLSKEMLGETSSCYLYDITSDIGLDNTGDFNGYIVTVPNDGEYKYYITLWNNNFMVYALEYKGGKYDDLLMNYDKTKTNELSPDYLAVVSGCTNYTEEKTKQNKKANPSEPIPYTGTKKGTNDWIAHYTNGEMDECYHKDPTNFCTGTFKDEIAKDYDSYPDQIDVCMEHKSFECCTSTSVTYYYYTFYEPIGKSCGYTKQYRNGKYMLYYFVDGGGSLPERGVNYEI